MKKLKNFIITGIMIIGCIAIFQSCKKSEAPANYNSDKSKLSLQIDSANALYNSATEGKQAGQYTVGSKATFKISINLAMAVITGSFTQQQVNNALGNLIRAESAFETNLIQQISPENLVAYWKFSGDATDATGNGHNGTLQTNYVGSTAATATDGGTLPVLIADRYGNANSAYYFNNGAYIEVPYDPTLHPSSFTITAWVKIPAANSNNYIFSLDHYFGYKFQLQSGNLLFLTVATDQGIFDTDDNPGAVQLNTWTQVIASFTNGQENFYINGKLTRTAVVTGNLAPLKTIVNLCIGNELPKSAYSLTDTSSPNYFYGSSFFIGAIDDVRLYNKVLSATEVNSLYVMESPN
jgi:hypothetical protein